MIIRKNTYQFVSWVVKVNCSVLGNVYLKALVGELSKGKVRKKKNLFVGKIYSRIINQTKC